MAYETAGVPEVEELSRIGAVEMDLIHLIEAPKLYESPQFQDMTHRLRDSEAVVEALHARGDLQLDSLLTGILTEIAQASGIDGMMIASEEGFPIAQSTHFSQGEVLAAIACLFVTTVERTQRENLIASVDEMSLRGLRGEQIVVRFFPGLEKRFFLVAHSATQKPHRRATARAIKLCGDLLLNSKVPEGHVAHRKPEPVTNQPALEEAPANTENNQKENDPNG